MNKEYKKHLYIKSFNYQNDFLAVMTPVEESDALRVILLNKENNFKEYETYVYTLNPRYLTNGIFNPKLALEKIAHDFIREKIAEAKEIKLEKEFREWDGSIVINEEDL